MKKFKIIWIAVSILAAIFFFAWGLWCIFMQPVHYALVCDSDSVSSCVRTEAKFSYDSMDARYFVYYLKLSSGQLVNYDETECTVSASGSKCEDSTTGINNTGSDRAIIPLSITAYRLRWQAH